MEVDVAVVGSKRGRSQVPQDRSITRRNPSQMARSRSPSASGLRDEKDLKKAEKVRESTLPIDRGGGGRMGRLGSQW